VTGGAGFSAPTFAMPCSPKGEHSVIAVDNLITGRLQNLEHLKRDRALIPQAGYLRAFRSGKVEYVPPLRFPASPRRYMTHGIPRCKSARQENVQHTGGCAQVRRYVLPGVDFGMLRRSA